MRRGTSDDPCPRPLGRQQLLSYIVIVLAVQAIVLAPLFLQSFAANDSSSTIFSWNLRADALEDRVEALGAVVAGRLYVFGGFSTRDLLISPFVDVYDPVADSWARLGMMPTPISHAMPAVDGETVWIAGGFVGNHPGPATAQVWKYHVPSNTWEPGPALPEPRGGGALVRYGRTLHYFGGFMADRETTASDHWTLAVDGGLAWQVATTMPAPRGHMSAIVLQNAIYSIGGQTGHDKNPVDRPEVYRYSPTANLWEERAALPAPRSHFESSTFLLRDRIVIVGGRTNTIPGQGQLATALLYDPLEDLWIALPQLPYTRLGPIAQLFDTQIIMATGGLQWNNPQRSTLGGVLDRSWELAHPQLPAARSAAAGARLGGKLYLAGAEAQSLARYDLAADRWDAAGATADAPLAGGGSALVAFEEQLYLFGGSGERAGQVQVYDPGANQWSVRAPMPVAASDVLAVAAAGALYLIWDSPGPAPAPTMARYDPATQAWQSLPAPPYSSRGAAMAHDSTALYLFGGLEGDQPQDRVQIYSFATKSWLTSVDPVSGIPAMPAPRRGARAAAIGDQVFLVGGTSLSAAGEQMLASSVDVYSPLTKLWRHETALPTPRVGAAMVAIADRIYVMGGSTLENIALASFVVYNTVPSQPSASTPTVVPSPSAQTDPPPTPSTSPSPDFQRRYLYLPMAEQSCFGFSYRCLAVYRFL